MVKIRKRLCFIIWLGCLLTYTACAKGNDAPVADPYEGRYYLMEDGSDEAEVRYETIGDKTTIDGYNAYLKMKKDGEELTAGQWMECAITNLKNKMEHHHEYFAQYEVDVSDENDTETYSFTLRFGDKGRSEYIVYLPEEDRYLTPEEWVREKDADGSFKKIRGKNPQYLTDKYDTFEERTVRIGDGKEISGSVVETKMALLRDFKPKEVLQLARDYAKKRLEQLEQALSEIEINGFSIQINQYGEFLYSIHLMKKEGENSLSVFEYEDEAKTSGYFITDEEWIELK